MRPHNNDQADTGYDPSRNNIRSRSMSARAPLSSASHALAPLRIGDREVGLGQPSYVVAEIGINHNGDMALARDGIAAAKEAGADAVKFQNYKTEDFLSDRGLMYSYVSAGKEVTEPQYDMFKRYELSDTQVVDLAEYAKQQRIDFHATPTSKAGIDVLMAAGVGVLKNGSDFLGHLPLIQDMGRTGLPTVLSTGMASASAIEDAINAFRSTGNEQLIVLHCVSKYPTPANELNLNRIATLRDSFGTHVGFSDHSEGVAAAAIAVSMGAVWIEKHFTISRDLPGPDHRFSSTPDELAALVRACRTADQAMGRGALASGTAEAVSAGSFTLSCVAARDMSPGERVSADDIAFRRPGNGWPPSLSEKLVGRTLKNAVESGHLFSLDDF